MIDLREVRGAPTVSVVLTTGAGAGNWADALRSALRQTCTSLQVLVANDGPDDLTRPVAACGDARVRLLQWPAPRGHAAALNEALRHATGRYVCYLGDDCIYYPNHVQVLVEALEGAGDCQAAYSDLYCTIFRTASDGRRQVLGKALLGGRDFDRFLLLHSSYVPQAALMHRRELLDRTGPYDEQTDALLEWDMNRRMAFLTDFLRVPRITGEVWAAEPPDPPPAEAEDAEDDRLHEQLLKVRTRRPPKPWPKVNDLAIVLAPRQVDGHAAAKVAEICTWTYVPYQLYAALPPEEAERLGRNVPHLCHVPVEAGWPWDARVDKALRSCDADHVAVLPPGLDVDAVAIESCAYVLEHHARPGEAVRLPPARGDAWGAVFRGQELRRARRRHPALSIRRSAEADGIAVRTPARHELPFAFDQMLRDARAAEADGNLLHAARAYEAIACSHGNGLWMKQAAAAALYRDGQHDPWALRACREVNQQRPTVSCLLLEARLCRRNDQAARAVRLLEQAKAVLDWTLDRKEPPC
jgi:hypothetical protein